MLKVPSHDASTYKLSMHRFAQNITLQHSCHPLQRHLIKD